MKRSVATWPRCRSGFVFGMLVAFAAGCSDANGGPDRVAMEGAPRAVEPAPLVQVGTQAGDALQEFHQVRTPFVLPDGRLAVPLGGSNEIRVFDADGAFVERLGRQGEGPGEFAVLSSAWHRGDTIEAADGRLRRVTRFLPDGTVEIVPLRAAAPGETVPPGPLRDGWVVGGIAGVRMNARDEIALHGFSLDGAHRGELARTKGIERIAVAGGSGVHPLSPRAVVRVGGDRIYVGETESPRIRVIDLHGDVEREFTWQVSAAPEPEAALRAVREAPDPLPLFAHLLPEAPIPERLSVFWDFLVDGLGFVWVRPYDPRVHAAALGGLEGGDYLTSPGGGGGSWLLLSPEGEVAGSVDVPEGLRPVQVTADRLVGIHVDTLGVETVRVHILTRH